MRIDYEGESYDFDMADITVKQGIKIEKYLGCPIAEFGERLYPSDGKSSDLMAVQCLGWLILHGGRGVPIEDTDFPVKKLMTAVGQAGAAAQDARQAAESAEAGPVPTAAGPASNGHMPAADAAAVTEQTLTAS
jgi:hypothetical protein